MATRLYALLFGVLFASQVWGLEVAGLQLEDKVTVEGAELALNGGGLRKRVFFQVYVIGLYLPSKSANAKEAISSQGKKRVQIHMLRDVGADQFTEALVEGLRANHDEAQFNALEPRVQQLASIMSQMKEARKGMRIALDWTGAATRVAVDGKPAGAPIAGEEFYRALLRIWLGDKPVQEDLKQALLGQPA